MGNGIFRSLFFLVCLGTGALSGPGFTSGSLGPLLGAAGGLAAFLVVWRAEKAVRSASPAAVLGAAVGVLAGLLGAVWTRQALGLEGFPVPALTGGAAVLVFVGAAAGARAVRAFWGGGGKLSVSSATGPKILDTSAIIDGRIADMVELGFIGGPLVVCQFVLNELQGIADSSDPLKRARGRRGLGILEKLQGIEGVEVRISEQDFPRIQEVDAKIVAAAKATGATVITNDFNLTKIAELQGLRVLNIHQLAHALRPVVLPGEEVRITLQKAGKEPGQGIGYMDDGTMVVVDGGASRLGESVLTAVTSVLQTTAGRMIFARPTGQAPAEEVKQRRGVWRRKG